MQKTSRRVLAIVLALIMALSVFSITASAYSPGNSTTHTVFKHTEQTLAPGVEYYKNYAYANDGEQNVYFVTTADITRSDVVVQTSYKDQFKDGVTGMSRLMNQVAFANEYYSDPDSPQFISEYYNVVAGANASFYNMTTGQPTGVCYIDGIDFGTNAYPAFFAILKDGTAVIDDRGNKGNYDIWQAVGGSQWLVRNGEDVTASASGDYNTERHCRTAIGVTADGKVVLMALDGRQSPYSIGGSMHEIAQIMLEADCVAAINLDGGGSTTFVAKEEGEDSVSIVNRPSDGSDRAISSGIIIASTAAPSNVFDRATLTAENEYMTVNATQTISAKGISPAGTSADIPAEATFVTDNGTITADGVFAPAQVGDATIQMVYNNEVVGETTVHVVVPDSIAFNITTLAVPYGKSSNIDFKMTYGDLNYDVKFDASDLEFTLSDPGFGTIDGMTFTATSDTTFTAQGTITATLLADTTQTVSIPLVVGKGSEVIFDFEDADVSGWSGGDMYNAGVVTTVSAVTAENGMVHSGDYAMAYNMDFSQLTYYEDYIASKMCYNADAILEHGKTNDPDGVQQKGATEDYVDITGAVGLGFWAYFPDEVAIEAFDPDFRIGGKKTATSAWTGCNGYMDDICDSNGLMVTNGDSNRAGWYYFHFDLSSFSSYYALRLQDARPSHTTTKNGKTIDWAGDILTWYITDAAWKKAGIKSYNSNFTIYIDDFTVDYSSVVPDRDAPIFSNFTYAFAGASDAMALNDNAVISASNELEFDVAVVENTAKTNASGLNTASAVAYVDGVETAVTYRNGKISLPETAFADGVHTVAFKMSDNTGNTSHITRTFTVNNNSDLDTVKVVARDADLTSTLVGSLYWIDIVATDVSKVDSVSTTLKVNNVNDWEIQGIEAADGFTASAAISSIDKGIVTLTIENLGNVNQAGEGVIASIPVRTWYPHNALGKDSNWIITQKKCVYPMDTQVSTNAGSVTFTDGTTSTFGAADIQCDSEAMCEHGYIGQNKGNEGGTMVVTSWHEHNAEPMEDKPATCTEDGYSGRTFCEECNSVIDWGTVMPATGHTYDFVDGVLKCVDCGELFNGEYTDGKLYVDGIAAAGWIGDKYYVDGEYVTGLYVVDGKYYDFDDNGDSQGLYTGLVQDDQGVYHYAKFGVPAGGWFEIEEEWYYFDETTLAPVAEKTFTYPNSKAVTTYQFFENGKIVDGVWVELAEGTRYYYGPDFYKLTAKTGNVWFADVHGETYGFDGMGFRHEGICFIKQSNNPMYLADFTDEGVYNGPYTGIYEGKYYVDGFVNAAGLIEVDGDYYYITQQGSVYKSGTLYLSDALTNGLVPAGKYEFDANGKMILKNGIVDGYYYEDGIIVAGKGLVKIDGDIYFVKQTGQIFIGNGLYVSEAKANGLKPAGSYDFDADGKLIEKAGIVDGKYYVDGVLVKSAGLIEFENALYYIKQTGEVFVGNGLYVSEAKANGLKPAGYYDFAADGKMIVKNGIVDGKYYENGTLVPGKGLVEFNGDLYFVKQSGEIFTGSSLYISEAKANGLVAPGYYTFEGGVLVTE